jgi:HTH-type transcriptional regulator/antitoxin HigA
MFTYHPNVAVKPGQTLVRLLSKNNLSQKDLALKTGLTEKHISNIIQGRASITDDTAIKLEYVFGGAASFWINLQNNYDEDVARLNFTESLKVEEKLVKLYPISVLIKKGFLSKVTNQTEKLKELLKFFGVASLKLIPNVQAVAYRKTIVKGKKIDQNAVAAWLRIGELAFQKVIENNPSLLEYNEDLFKKQLSEIKKMTKGLDCAEKLPKKLLEYGIILVYSPYLPNTSVSGALRWFGSRPLIQINDHFQAADSFYFSLFHEFAHMILHDKREEYVDYGEIEKEKYEKDADEWACNMLIGENNYQEFINNKDFSLTAIIKFANKLEINRDIIIGRLAHDGKMSWANRARLVGKVIYSA